MIHADRRYYNPLRLPLGHLPLPGSTGYRQASFPHPQRGAKEALSSSQDTLVTIPLPLRREVLRHLLQDQRCRPWPSPFKARARLLLAPLTRPVLTTLQNSLNAADWPLARPQKGLCCSASTPASQPTPGAALPGTLASPRAGLTPAGCPGLDARLHSIPPFCPECPDCWTRARIHRCADVVGGYCVRGWSAGARCGRGRGVRRTSLSGCPFLSGRAVSGGWSVCRRRWWAAGEEEQRVPGTGPGPGTGQVQGEAPGGGGDPGGHGDELAPDCRGGRFR